MNRNQSKGHINEVTGKTKEATGRVIGNKRLERKGQSQNASGAIQAAFGDLQSDVQKTSHSTRRSGLR
ncbi:MAG: CsbD family protein [Gammaproteobacteria bacterium]